MADKVTLIGVVTLGADGGFREASLQHFPEVLNLVLDIGLLVGHNPRQVLDGK